MMLRRVWRYLLTILTVCQFGRAERQLVSMLYAIGLEARDPRRPFE